MKYGVLAKMRKGVSMLVSIALVLSIAPVMPVSAEETSSGGSGKKIKDVNMGFVGTSLPPNIADEKEVVLSSAQSFNRQGAVAQVGDSSPVSGWFYAVKDPSCGENSMEASVEGGKITAVTGYEDADGYTNPYTFKISHKTLTEVYKGASQISVLITSQDNEVMYYGNGAGKVTDYDATSFNFCIPSGMETGLYKMYVFAENISSGTNPTYSSALGEPINIEVVPSIKMEVYSIDEPKAGAIPDTSAVLKVETEGKSTTSNDVAVTWLDETGNRVTGRYNNGRQYTAYVNMKDFGPVYFNQNPDVYINGEKAKILDAIDGTFSLYNTFNATEAVKVQIAGVVSGSAISLKAYTTGYSDIDYTYEWYNSLDTSLPATRSSEYNLLSTDVDNRISVKVYDDTNTEVGASYLDIAKDEMLKVDSVTGVSKTDETVKGKADGTLSGLKDTMEFSSDNSTYSQCTDSTITGLEPGEYYIRMKSGSSVVPAGIDGIYASYNIEEGKTVTIIFNSNGGSNVDSITDIVYGIIGKPADPVKEGYTFAGWYKEEDCLNIWDFDKDKADTDIILYAKWNKNQEGTGTNPGPDGTQTPGSTETTAPDTTTKPSGTTGIWYPSAGTNPAQTTEPTIVPAQTTEPTVVPVQTAIPTVVPVQTAEPSSVPTQAPENEKTEEPLDVDKTINKVTKNGSEYTVDDNSGSVSLSSMNVPKYGKVKIPDKVTVNGQTYTVTSIDSGVFKNNKKVIVVTLGNNVKTIGNEAFKGCTNLKEVKFASGLTTVGKNSFKGCTALKSVKLPDTVTNIGKGAFKGCTSLTKFKVGKKKSENNNKKLSIRQNGKNIVLEYSPDTGSMFGASAAKVVIGASALENCVKLSLVVINSQVTKIGNSTFKHCSKLRKMLVRSLKLKTVGNQALKGVNNCKISVPPVKIKPYTKLFKNKGQGKKVVIAKS